MNLAVLYGGQSTEHEISIKSATGVVENLDRDKYEIHLIKVSKEGEWIYQGDQGVSASNEGKLVSFIRRKGQVKVIDLKDGTIISSIDVAFPVLHGLNGEDGTIQGLFSLLKLNYVGCDVFSSAACIDKDYCKRLLADAGIPVSPGTVFFSHKQEDISFERVESDYGMPVYIKPAKLGSSVGVHKVYNKEDFEKAMQDAFTYDEKVLVEQNIECREIECAVLGNKDAKSSILGEITSNTEFYSFESKYENADGANLYIPARIEDDLSDQLRKMAVEAFKVMGCEGLSRVDFFLTKENDVYINEINTLPGFTTISMYPKLWEATGLSYGSLLDELIKLARERF